MNNIKLCINEKLPHSNHEYIDPKMLLSSKDIISREALDKIKESNEVNESEVNVLARLNNMNDGLIYSIDTVRTLKTQQNKVSKKNIGITSNMTSAEELLLHVQSR